MFDVNEGLSHRQAQDLQLTSAVGSVIIWLQNVDNA